MYIFWFLHQTTTVFHPIIKLNKLYIFWFLHQTTTRVVALMVMEGCISFDSYIKPQLVQVLLSVLQVVYLLIPTSNHNLAAALDGLEVLYIFWFLHQTTTSYHHTFSDVSLYIFWFLHQTTTYRFESTDFQCITITSSNKKWRAEYNFQCKSTKKTPIE